MKTMPAAAFGLAFLLASMSAALAQAPVAVVEDINSKSAGIEFMDYVSAGKVIKLGPQDTLVLGFMKSCVRESILGGTVVVATEQSLVQYGKVSREKVDCDGGRMQLTAEQASQSSGMVFRGMPRAKQGGQPGDAQVTIYGVSPIVELRGSSPLIIERIDRPGERLEIPYTQKQLVHGLFYDLAKNDKALTAGGTYRAKAGSSELIFAVDHDAKPGAVAVVSRLLRLQPKS